MCILFKQGRGWLAIGKFGTTPKQSANSRLTWSPVVFFLRSLFLYHGCLQMAEHGLWYTFFSLACTAITVYTCCLITWSQWANQKRFATHSTSKTKKSYSVTKHPLNPVTRTRQLAKHFAMFRSYVPQCNCTLFKGTVDQIKFFLKSASTHFGFNLKARLNLSVLSYCTWNL